ncbi:MAG: SEC-C domain-containing protein, partial [Burkholderiales bacterium]|nr:SEC-C domain-containing protein [Burkholderiales bacterium]
FLAFIGTERHVSRRIDNQLRGRAARQGDAGSSRFYLSLDDPLLRIFGGERMRGMMQKLGMKPGEAIEHKWLSRSIESAQRKVEGHNFDIRKQLLDYDNVFNEQRQVIYEQRNNLLESDDLSDTTDAMVKGVVGNKFAEYIPPRSNDDLWNVVGLEKFINDIYLVKYDLTSRISQDSKVTEDTLHQELVDLVYNNYQAKMKAFSDKINADIRFFVESNIEGDDKANWNIAVLDSFCKQNAIELSESFVELGEKSPQITRKELIDKFLQLVGNMGKLQALRFERGILLQHIDYYWREHLTQLEQLKQGIHLRGYAQKDPKREFQNEAFNLFAIMLDNIKNEAVRMLVTVNIQNTNDIPTEDTKLEQQAKFIHQDAQSAFSNRVQNINRATNAPANKPVIGRNVPCPCGSGKKYKHCHGKL